MEKIQFIAEFLINAIEKEFNIKIKKIEIEKNETNTLIAIEKIEEKE